MEVIIHGKPLDASERCSAGVDKTFARKLIDEFFALGPVKEPEALVVDARYWQGVWLSVYTLLLSKSIRDKAERESYFAISLILPQHYCCVVSQVYSLLAKIVSENVIGTYLDKNGRYLVQHFDNPAAFERLCANLQSSYRNLEKPFDRSFQPQAVLHSDLYYSINDCDSLAFVNQLKTKGRIIVTEKTEAKDVLAAHSIKYMREAQQYREEVVKKQTKIAELESRLSQLEEASRKANSSVNGKVKKLESQVEALKVENEQLNNKLEKSRASLNSLQDKASQAAQLLGISGQQTANHVKENRREEKTLGNKGFLSYIPAVNTLLILLVSVVLLMNLKGCSDKDDSVQEDLDAAQVQVETLSSEIEQKDKEILRLREDNEALEQTLEKHKEEMDNTMRQLQERTRQLAAPRNMEKILPQPKTEQKKDSKTEKKHESSSASNNNKKDTKK